MSSITKHWGDAGSRPGQRQDLKIEFVSRNGNSVKIKWELKVRSNGTDMYDYSTRHNSARIYSPKDTRVSTETYQAKGHHASKTVSDTFTLNNIENDTDKIDFWYKNKRVWVKHTDANEPRSTGVVDKTHVGTLSIPKNKKYKITFNYVISDTVKEYSCWHNNNFTIPKLSPNSNRYSFLGWTTKKYKNELSDIKKASASVYSGNKLKNVTSNHTYYAVWRPRRCTYRFLNYNGTKAYDKSHDYGTPTKVENLDKVENNLFKVPGYSFVNWTAIRSGKTYTYNPGKTSNLWPEDMSKSSIIKFVPHNEPDSNTIQFNFLNPNNDTRIFRKDSEEACYTDSQFDISKALTDQSGAVRFTDITVWPGYKLVGWSTSKLSIAQPGKALNAGDYNSSADGMATKAFTIYPLSGKQSFDYNYFNNHTLNLYGYYEYYTTCYIYTENGWKLAMPYVYTENGWKQALSYVYTENGWKL